MRTVLYIAGTAHGGSTLLEMLLCAQPRVCGLGEIAMLIDDRTRPRYVATADERICSCGRSIAACPLWSRFLAWIEGAGDAPPAERYGALFRLVDEVVGEDQVIVDSSKYLEPLVRLASFAGASDLRLVVIHLVRDVRSFATSNARRSRLGSLGGIASFGRWYRSHRKLERYLAESGLPHVRVGYEELCFDPRLVLRAIGNAAGIEFDERRLDPAHGRAHIGVGNPMRTHPVKSRQVIYDCAWLVDSTVQLFHLLRPRIRRYNNRAVYGNILPARRGPLFEPATPAAGAGQDLEPGQPVPASAARSP